MQQVRTLVRHMPPRETVNWEEMATGLYQVEGSAGEVILRRLYAEALQGHGPSIKAMLKLIRRHHAAARKRKEAAARLGQVDRFEQVTSRMVREERRADPALLLLGIGLVDNATIHMLGDPADPYYEGELKALAPTHLANWVVDWALAREECPELTGAELLTIRSECAGEDDPVVSTWRAEKDSLLEQIVALRGPQGSRFAPGQSGNTRGRPRKRVTYGYPEEGPFGAYFDELVPITVHGVPEQVSRIDALMVKLCGEAAQGDIKLAAMIGPELLNAFMRQWEDRFEAPPLLETRI